MGAGLALALSALVVAAQEDTVVLTPDTMANHGFVLACQFIEHTTIEDDKPKPNGLVTVRIDFDPAKGPAIKEIQSVYLFLRDGDTLLLSVPVRVSSYPELQNIRRLHITMQKEMLPKARLVLSQCGEDQCRLFAVDLNAFADAND